MFVNTGGGGKGIRPNQHSQQQQQQQQQVGQHHHQQHQQQQQQQQQQHQSHHQQLHNSQGSTQSSANSHPHPHQQQHQTHLHQQQTLQQQAYQHHQNLYVPYTIHTQPPPPQQSGHTTHLYQSQLVGNNGGAGGATQLQNSQSTHGISTAGGVGGGGSQQGGGGGGSSGGVNQNVNNAGGNTNQRHGSSTSHYSTGNTIIQTTLPTANTPFMTSAYHVAVQQPNAVMLAAPYSTATAGQHGNPAGGQSIIYKSQPQQTQSHQQATGLHSVQSTMHYLANANGVTAGPSSAGLHHHSHQHQMRNMLVSAHPRAPYYIQPNIYTMPQGLHQHPSLLTNAHQQQTAAAANQLQNTATRAGSAGPTGYVAPSPYLTPPIQMGPSTSLGQQTSSLLSASSPHIQQSIQSYGHLTGSTSSSGSSTSLNMQSLGGIASMGVSEHSTNTKPRKHAIPIIDPLTKQVVNLDADQPVKSTATIELKPPPTLLPAPTTAAAATTTSITTAAASTESQRTHLDDKPISSAITITKPKESNKSTTVSLESAPVTKETKTLGQNKIDQQMQTDVVSDKNSEQVLPADVTVAGSAASPGTVNNESQSPTCILTSTIDPDDTDADANELDDDDADDKSLQMRESCYLPAIADYCNENEFKAAAAIEDCGDDTEPNTETEAFQQRQQQQQQQYVDEEEQSLYSAAHQQQQEDVLQQSLTATSATEEHKQQPLEDDDEAGWTKVPSSSRSMDRNSSKSIGVANQYAATALNRQHSDDKTASTSNHAAYAAQKKDKNNLSSAVATSSVAPQKPQKEQVKLVKLPAASANPAMNTKHQQQKPIVAAAAATITQQEPAIQKQHQELIVESVDDTTAAINDNNNSNAFTIVMNKKKGKAGKRVAKQEVPKKSQPVQQQQQQQPLPKTQDTTSSSANHRNIAAAAASSTNKPATAATTTATTAITTNVNNNNLPSSASGTTSNALPTDIHNANTVISSSASVGGCNNNNNNSSSSNNNNNNNSKDFSKQQQQKLSTNKTRKSEKNEADEQQQQQANKQHVKSKEITEQFLQSDSTEATISNSANTATTTTPTTTTTTTETLVTKTNEDQMQFLNSSSSSAEQEEEDRAKAKQQQQLEKKQQQQQQEPREQRQSRSSGIRFGDFKENEKLPAFNDYHQKAPMPHFAHKANLNKTKAASIAAASATPLIADTVDCVPMGYGSGGQQSAVVAPLKTSKTQNISQQQKTAKDERIQYTLDQLRKLGEAPQSRIPPLVPCSKSDCISQLFVPHSQSHHLAHALNLPQQFQQMNFSESMDFVGGKRGARPVQQRKHHDQGMGNVKNTGYGMSSGGSVSIGPGITQTGEKIIRINLSLNEEIKLSQCENAWQPETLRSSKSSASSPAANGANDDLAAVLKKVRGVLNKLTPDNFDVLLKTLSTIALNTQEKMQQVMLLIFEKTVSEPNFAPTYAKFCKALFQEVKPESKLLNNSIILRIQQEFEMNVNDANAKKLKLQPLVEKLEASTDAKERAEIQAEIEDQEYQFRRRAWGTVRFIGEMYKLQSLTSDRVLHCIEQLQGHDSEEKLEYMCKLLTTVGHLLETTTAPRDYNCKERMDKIFGRMKDIINKAKSKNNTQVKISSRVRFMMQDVMDLRARGWGQTAGSANDISSRSSSSSRSQHQQQQQQQQHQQHQQQQQHRRRQDDKSSGGGMGSQFDRNSHRMGGGYGGGGGGGANQRQSRLMSHDQRDGGGYYGQNKQKSQYMQQEQQSIDLNKLNFGDSSQSTTTLGSSSNYNWRHAHEGNNSKPPMTLTSMHQRHRDSTSSSSMTSSSAFNMNSLNRRQPQLSTHNQFHMLSPSRNSRFDSSDREIPSTTSHTSASSSNDNPSDEDIAADDNAKTNTNSSASSLEFNRKIINHLLEEYMDCSRANSAVWQEEALKTWSRIKHAQRIHLIHYLLVNYLHLANVKKAQRTACATIFSHLFAVKAIDKKMFVKAYDRFIEELPDILDDVPKVWTYVFEFLGLLLHNHQLKINDVWHADWRDNGSLTEKFVEAMIVHFTSDYGANFVRYLWHDEFDLGKGDRFISDSQKWTEFITKYGLQYVYDANVKAKKPTGISDEQHVKRVEVLLNENCDYAIDYISTNVNITNNFIRNLTSFLCCDYATVMITPGANNNSSSSKQRKPQLNVEKCRTICVPLLRLSIDTREEFEISCLNAVVQSLQEQDYDTSTLTVEIFDILYDCEVIAKESFEKWYRQQGQQETKSSSSSAEAATKNKELSSNLRAYMQKLL